MTIRHRDLEASQRPARSDRRVRQAMRPQWLPLPELPHAHSGTCPAGRPARGRVHRTEPVGGPSRLTRRWLPLLDHELPGGPDSRGVHRSQRPDARPGRLQPGVGGLRRASRL